MDKRNFLKLSAIATTGVILSPFYACQPTAKQVDKKEIRTKDFVLPALPFALEALEPNIDKMTMEIHHGKHHAGYVRKLNKAVADTKFAQMPLLDIMGTVTEEDTAVRNNGGGHFNHTLFWSILAPNAGGQAEGKLAEAINTAFGSFEKFKEEFSKAAKTRFGSGWAWLSLDDANKLFISSTPNQDNPLMTNLVEQNGTPILGIDVWEHAYYLKHQNVRGNYINNFFNVINWRTVSENYQNVIG